MAQRQDDETRLRAARHFEMTRRPRAKAVEPDTEQGWVIAAALVAAFIAASALTALF
jgi:nucleoid DNA-binding protein